MSLQVNWVSQVQRFTGIALLTGVLSACDRTAAEEAHAPPPPDVSVASVIVKQVKQWDSFNGRIEAVESVQLRPRVSGYIDKVSYQEGQEVKKGQLLFTIDDRTYRAALEQAQAELARARSQASLARSESARTEKLIHTQAISREQWEQRRATASQAQAEVMAAQAGVDQATLNLTFTQVTAPIDGRASRALITSGNMVSAGDSASVLTTLVSQEKMYVMFDVDEATWLRYQSMVQRGQNRSALPVGVALTGEQGFPHRGVIDFQDNQLTASTGTLRMRAVLDNTQRQLTPGLFARVQLPGSAGFSALLIDDKAIMTDQDRKYVYVLDAQGKAERRDIQTGGMADGLRIINQGLKAGDKVIVTGLQKVFMPGMPVKAHDVAMNSAAVTH